jgi:hypothetical protein
MKSRIELIELIILLIASFVIGIIMAYETGEYNAIKSNSNSDYIEPTFIRYPIGDKLNEINNIAEYKPGLPFAEDIDNDHCLSRIDQIKLITGDYLYVYYRDCNRIDLSQFQLLDSDFNPADL